MDSGITDSGYNQLWIQDFPLGGGTDTGTFWQKCM